MQPDSICKHPVLIILHDKCELLDVTL